MRATILIITLALCSSCYTPQRAAKQVAKAQAVHPVVVGGLCSDFYPPTESITERIEYLPGEVRIIPGDTVIVDCDTVSSGELVRIPCPPSSHRTDTIYRYLQTQVVDKGRIQELEAQASRHQEAYIKVKVGRDTWRTIGLAGIGLAVLWILSKTVLRKFIP